MDLTRDGDTQARPASLELLGALTVARQRLHQGVREIARACNPAVDAEAPELVLVEALASAHSSLPPWADHTLSRDELARYFAEARDLLSRVEAVCSALGESVNSPRWRDPDSGDIEFITARHLDELIEACLLLVGEGDRLMELLSLETRSGAKIFGYSAIVRRLYAAATDATLPDELRPALTPSAGWPGARA